MVDEETSQSLAEQEWRSRPPSNEAVRKALDRLLGDPRFKASSRNRRFLKYVVDEALAGRVQQIKSYSIAIDVMGRKPSFDGAVDPIVRIEATRLRSALNAYYAGPGANEEIRIDLPKGGYVPSFLTICPPASELIRIAAAASDVPARTALLSLAVRAHPWLLPVGVIGLVMGLGSIAVYESRLDPLWGTTGSVVLLEPTTAMGDDPAEVQRARGLSQSVETALTHFRGLQVILVDGAQQRAEAMKTFGGRPTTIYTVRSSIRLDSQFLRIWWSLSNARSGEVIWSEIDDHESEGQVTRIEDEIAARIATQTGAPTGILSVLDGGREAQMPATAYGCVLRARGYYERYTAAEHAEVRACLEETVTRVPQYSDAWAMLAFVYNDEDRNGYNIRISRAESSQRALAAAERAVNLAPSSDLAHEALMDVQYRRGDFAAAEEAGRRALALNPNNPEVKAELGIRLFARGNWDEGAAMVRQAAKASFFVPALNRFTLAFDHYRKEEYLAALKEANNIGMPGFYGVWVLKAAIYGQLGNATDARRCLAELQKLRPNYDLREDLGARHYTTPFIEIMAEGLKKAGLEVH
jgi:Flp pilus assembly protein TadD/TolB-like protein